MPGYTSEMIMHEKRNAFVTALAFLVLLLTVAAVDAQPAPLRGPDAFGDWQRDKPGTVRLIRPDDLQKPGATPSAANASRVVPRPASATPQVPPGFKIELFAEGLSGPRIVRTAPNGDIFVVETRSGRISVLRTPDGPSTPSTSEVYASGLRQPFGVAFFPRGDNPQWLYVANTDSIVRFAYRNGDLKARGGPQVIIPKLTATHSDHWTRDIAFSPDGRRMFVSVGSGSNDAEGMPKKTA